MTNIVSHVAQQVSNGFVPDFVFITGDIANRATKQEYKTFRSDFINPLREALGGKVWDGYIVAVPGNHDVERAKNSDFDRSGPLAATSRFFDPDKQGKVIRDIISPRFKAYRQGDVADIPSNWISNSEGTFSEKFNIRGVNVGVVGINTAWLSKDDKDRYQLTPGVPLVDAALERVKNCQVCFVLGHHPLNWLHEESTQRLRALFGQHSVIYLHGHMHQADGTREDGSGNDFLVFQAGAAFQARDGEPWENGLLWGEINISENKINLSPRFWNPNNRDWPVRTGKFPENRRENGSDWWSYPLPNHRNSKSARPTEQWNVPAGWEMLTKEKLTSLQRDILIDEAERFFDGAETDWALAQSPKIARRAKVNVLAKQLIDYQSQERPLVLHLTGPGGEGKSMVLRQTLVSILELNSTSNILWHADDTSSFPLESIANMPEGPWIITTDAADVVAKSIHSIVKELNRTRRTDISFLLCSRDSDWRASGAERLDWQKYSDFRIENMSGLNEADAKLIATSWCAFDKEKKPSDTIIQEKSLALFEATRREAAISEGTLLGGILAIRYGAGLRAHIAKLMERLKGYSLESGGNLYEAFAYIAVMHAENLDFLSRQVLAKVLKCKPTDIGKLVIVPLAKEAAANGGTLLLTRHKRIAETAVAIMREEYGEDMTERFVVLASAAQSIKQLDNIFVPELHRWRYELPEYFSKKSPETTIKITHALLELDPENERLAVNLARIYRESKEPEEGIKVLENFTGSTGRGFWYEWSTCAGTAGHTSLNAVLAAWSLADQSAMAPPNIRDITFILAGIGISLGELYEQFLDKRFATARATVAWLGLQLPVEPKSLSYFKKHQSETALLGVNIPIDLGDALSKLKEGIIAAWDICDVQQYISKRIGLPQHYSFDGMATLFSRIRITDA
ncbi:metallophosphoesterase [Aeromonas allosaccharophila]|nr:metallophosphoesterase [Aeromonas allosaccharophila]